MGFTTSAPQVTNGKVTNGKVTNGGTGNGGGSTNTTLASPSRSAAAMLNAIAQDGVENNNEGVQHAGTQIENVMAQKEALEKEVADLEVELVGMEEDLQAKADKANRTKNSWHSFISGDKKKAARNKYDRAAAAYKKAEAQVMQKKAHIDEKKKQLDDVIQQIKVSNNASGNLVDGVKGVTDQINNEAVSGNKQSQSS